MTATPADELRTAAVAMRNQEQDATLLAVAGWLDGCAALSDMTDANYADSGNGQPTGRHWALAVARAYLGTTEQVTA